MLTAKRVSAGTVVWGHDHVPSRGVAEVVSVSDLSTAATPRPEARLLDLGGAEMFGANGESVVRRFEYYRYSGNNDPHNGESLPNNCDTCIPTAGDLGVFIGAQNDAVNFNGNPAANNVPEPASLVLSLVGLLGLATARRRR